VYYITLTGDIMVYTSDFLIGILYHFGLHSNYNYKRHNFDKKYVCCDITFNMAKAKSAIEKRRNELGEIIDTNHVFIIPFSGIIPEKIINSMQELCILNNKFAFDILKEHYLVVSAESFILLLIFLKNNNSLDISEIKDIVKDCEKRYVQNECFYGEEKDLKYLSQKAFDFYAEKKPNDINNIDLDIFSTLQEIDDINYENLENRDNGFYRNALYSFAGNNDTRTSFESFRAMPNVKYSILHRWRFISLNENINYGLANKFMNHFFNISMDAYELILEHESQAKFADHYELKHFKDYRINGINFVFTDIYSNRLVIVYNICNGELIIFRSDVDKSPQMLDRRIASNIDKMYINGILAMLNVVINKDIKNPYTLTKKD
jgi:hypothetical protein